VKTAAPFRMYPGSRGETAFGRDLTYFCPRCGQYDGPLLNRAPLCWDQLLEEVA
jgi:hypothetical protein